MELLYHYIWYHKMLGTELTDVRGRKIEVIFPGRHNGDAGPDFLDARLLIDGRKWVGNVEIHVKASDWFRHGHDSDPAYDNVILHLVAFDDARVRRHSNGEEIPQITAILPKNFYLTYAELVDGLRGIRCEKKVRLLPRLVVEDWLETLSVERMQAKANRLLEYNRQTGGDWEQAVFILLARGLGFNLNSLPFEMLAKNIPLKIIYHHSDNLMQIEALLFGQAGMLDPTNHLFDQYYQTLCNEYLFLARKYGLRPMDPSVWKYARTRPGNFPHRRIAILASALFNGRRFSSTLREAKGDYDALHKLFSWHMGDYWTSHFNFGQEESQSVLPPKLSKASRDLLIINVAAPFYMAHAHISGDYDSGENALELLRIIPPEKNSRIKSWESAGIKPGDALRSQSLLHLFTEYCENSKCLECRFGHYILRKEMSVNNPERLTLCCESQ